MRNNLGQGTMVLLIVPLLLAVSISGFAATLSPEQTSEMGQKKSACAASGGQWGIFDDAAEESCNLLTKDKHKFCMDGSECEGDCIASLDATQKLELEKGRKIYMKGKCSEWTVQTGCFPSVHQGFVSMECHYKKKA